MFVRSSATVLKGAHARGVSQVRALHVENTVNNVRVPISTPSKRGGTLPCPSTDFCFYTCRTSRLNMKRGVRL